ncbi:ABC transporter permease subunit [Streptomyces sp. NBC_00433]
MLDVMQTLPAFVYLIPAIIFFSLGTVPAVIATIVFAMPVGVRMTELGIRQVDPELVEAADAFGTTPARTLLRVQLPPALPTIMAGVNQVIMLALSMVVIGGMAGAEGLGSTVFGAISQVDIGLGFEGGVSVVVLAVCLDRLTGAMGEQVSALGRRAAARSRGSLRGFAVLRYRPRPAVGLSCVVALALVAGGTGVFAGNSPTAAPTAAGADTGKGRSVTIGSFNWDESIASANLWKAALDARGYPAQVKTYDPGAAFTGLARGTPSWADPKSLWGPGDSIHDLAGRSAATRLPQVSSWMRNFRMTEPQLSSLGAAIQAAGRGNTAEGVQKWIAANPRVIDAMAPVGAGG